MTSWAERCRGYDAFVSKLKTDRLATTLAEMQGKLDALSDKVAELEELTAKLKRRRCGCCCNEEVCEYE